jgi:hypothetical protein
MFQTSFDLKSRGLVLFAPLVFISIKLNLSAITGIGVSFAKEFNAHFTASKYKSSCQVPNF